MSNYKGKRPRGMTAAQLGITVIATLILFAVIGIHAAAAYCDIPVRDQIRDMLLTPLH